MISWEKNYEIIMDFENIDSIIELFNYFKFHSVLCSYTSLYKIISIFICVATFIINQKINITITCLTLLKNKSNPKISEILYIDNDSIITGVGRTGCAKDD